MVEIVPTKIVCKRLSGHGIKLKKADFFAINAPYSTMMSVLDLQKKSERTPWDTNALPCAAGHQCKYAPNTPIGDDNILGCTVQTG